MSYEVIRRSQKPVSFWDKMFWVQNSIRMMKTVTSKHIKVFTAVWGHPSCDVGSENKVFKEKCNTAIAKTTFDLQTVGETSQL